MRAFVLCTGRCGSHTVAAACRHLPGYSVGHESRAGTFVGRLSYPDRHVEVDNRLAWFLGDLDQRYGDAPVYVHLTRDRDAVAQSYAARWHVRDGLMPAFARGIVRPGQQPDPMQSALTLVDTVTANIDAFLDYKTRVVDMPIEAPHEPFDELCRLLDVDPPAAGHAALDEVHNAG